MSTTDLCYLSATEALALFRARKLSPVELLQAVVARAEATEPKVNALPIRRFDAAMEEARVAEARYQGRGRRPRPLEGLPLAVKDESSIAGWPTTNGSLILRDWVPTATDPTIGRVLAAGAVVHARSATPEFSCAPYTHSRLWGITRTPWNLDYSPGGSSGGAGASLAAGSTTLATGSDIGGSIRIPASMSGVVGYKPPYGRNPQAAPFNLDHYCHIGPMARTVADCALLQGVMAGPHPLDITSLRPKVVPPRSFRPVQGWRIAVSLDLDGFDVDPDVVENTLHAVEVFRSLGATVEEVKLGWSRDDIARAAEVHFAAIFGPFVAAQAREHAEIMTPYALAFARSCARYRMADVLDGLGIEGRLYETFGPLMERYRVLLCPTLPVPAVEAGEDYVERPLTINGKPQADICHWLMTVCFNILSRCPVMSLPSGRAQTGVPTGLSIVGRSYDDASVFHAAAAFERAVGGWYGTAETRPAL